MPKVWISYDFGFGNFVMWDTPPDGVSSQVVEVEMNGSLHRQIRSTERKFEKFQGILDKFFKEAQQHPGQVRRVR